MDIEQSGMSVEVSSADDRRIDRTIIPAAARTTVIGRMSSRRRWTLEQKLAIVAASYDPAASVQQVADRFEIFPAQIYNWRREVADQSPGISSAAPASFARVSLAQTSSALDHGSARSGIIEIRLGHETTIVVGEDVNEGALRRVLGALGR
jgi:transposase